MSLFHADDSEDRCRCGSQRMTDDPTIPACAMPYHCPALLADRAADQAEIARLACGDKFYENGERTTHGVRCF